MEKAKIEKIGTGSAARATLFVGLALTLMATLALAVLGAILHSMNLSAHISSSLGAGSFSSTVEKLLSPVYLGLIGLGAGLFFSLLASLLASILASTYNLFSRWGMGVTVALSPQKLLGPTVEQPEVEVREALSPMPVSMSAPSPLAQPIVRSPSTSRRQRPLSLAGVKSNPSLASEEAAVAATRLPTAAPPTTDS